MLSGLPTAPFHNYDDGDGDDGGDDDGMMKMKMVNMIGLGSVGKSKCFYRSCEKEGRSETEGKWALGCKYVLLIIDCKCSQCHLVVLLIQSIVNAVNFPNTVGCVDN